MKLMLWYFCLIGEYHFSKYRNMASAQAKESTEHIAKYADMTRQWKRKRDGESHSCCTLYMRMGSW